MEVFGGEKMGPVMQLLRKVWKSSVPEDTLWGNWCRGQGQNDMQTILQAVSGKRGIG